MKVFVDLSVCTGHAHCAHKCPEVFDNDENMGLCVILLEEVPPHLEEDVQYAVRSCPEGALRIEE